MCINWFLHCFRTKCFRTKWTWGTLEQPTEEPRLMHCMGTCSKNWDRLPLQKLFLTMQSLEFQDIWPKNSLETTWMIYREKSEFWYREFLIPQKIIYGELRIIFIAYVKILLEQCWQKGFQVNLYWAKDEENLTTVFS